MTFSFSYTKTPYQKARLGTLTTPSGTIQTPAFIFCATKAAIKGLTISQVKECGTQIILSNTYHLMLQPGDELIHQQGGLQRFTGFLGPMLTDSGGFQIFSLGCGSVGDEIKGKRSTHRPKTLLKITEDGALFKSYIDGRPHFLTPEKSIRIQRNLGADLIVVFDECTPFHVEKSYTESSMNRSHRWALRSFHEFQRLQKDKDSQRLYGIIQGGIYPDLRRISCDFVNNTSFFGHAIGGSLGCSKTQMYDVVHETSQLLVSERPIHLLGIGGISDIFNGILAGIDTFDCVHPTRIARHGGALVKAIYRESQKEHINLNNACFKNDSLPLEADCPCSTCHHHSRAYIHHLLKARELTALLLLSIHNITFMNEMMKAIRSALCAHTLDDVRQTWMGAHCN